jgi:hypothetical protein
MDPHTPHQIPIVPGAPQPTPHNEPDIDEEFNEEDYEEDDEDPQAKKKATTWKVGLIVVGLVGLVVACIIGSMQSNSRPTNGYDAKVACENFVKDRLKAPSTADFSHVTYSGGPSTWTVIGAVDAENSFGANGACQDL